MLDERKTLFLQNIIAPYRVSLFNGLKSEGLHFEVYYMSETEADRSWAINYADIKYPYWVDKCGFYSFIFGLHIHFNPLLIKKILQNDGVSDIVFAVSWNDINIIILAFLKKLGILKKKVHCWTEANYLTLGASRDSRFKKWLRKFVYSSIDGAFIIPGRMAKETLDLWGITYNTLVFLPNLISEEKFVLRNQKDVCNKENTLPTFILPVRLLEKVKGVLNFLDSIGEVNVRSGFFLIAGDGPDLKKYEEYIALNNYRENVKLLGFCNSSQMLDLYTKADVLILPSFSDPSPLTLIEALIMRLPILASKHCGNHFETIVENQNGYIFDPHDRSSIKNTFEKMLSNRMLWNEWGENSYQIYMKNFSSETCLKKFIGDFSLL